MKEIILCMKHIMDLLEDISNQTQLQRKSNNKGYGGQHFTKIAKILLDNVTNVNDWVDPFLAQKFLWYQ